MYDQIDGEKSINDIFSLLLKEYDVAQDVARIDIEQFINNTVNKGILFEKQ